MLILPAIDLRNGKVVRLYRGRYEEETVYSDDPVGVACAWKEQGAQVIHVVDLDGALCGEPKNLDLVKKIILQTGVDVHLGGGIRSVEAMRMVRDAGVTKIIMSTKIFADDTFLSRIDQDMAERIIVSIDSKSGMVMDKGWTGLTSLFVVDALRRIAQTPVRRVIVTDTASDGTLAGPNMKLLESVLRESALDVYAAGGMGSLADVKSLCALAERFTQLKGIIIGKALYEGTINLKEAIDYAR